MAMTCFRLRTNRVDGMLRYRTVSWSQFATRISLLIIRSDKRINILRPRLAGSNEADINAQGDYQWVLRKSMTNESSHARVHCAQVLDPIIRSCEP